MDVLIIFACFYFAYSSVNAVLKSEGPWGWGQYASLVIAALLVILGVIRTVNYIRTYKSRQEEREKKQQEEMQKIHEQRRRAYLYDVEGYLDEETETVTPEEQKEEEDDGFLDRLFEKQAIALSGGDVKDVTDEPEEASADSEDQEPEDNESQEPADGEDEPKPADEEQNGNDSDAADGE